MSAHTSKKRKRNVVLHQSNGSDTGTSKPTAVFQPTGGRSYTLSIALPGSIIANAQTHDLKTALAGQIARAAAVFSVDEVVIFNDGQSRKSSHSDRRHWQNHQGKQYRDREHGTDEDGYTGWSDPDQFLYHLLSYLETPPHLRKSLFPHHPNLRTAGTLPSLDMPHHLRADEWCQFREGVTLERDESIHVVEGVDPDGSKGKKQRRSHTNSDPPIIVNAGLRQPVHISTPIPPYTRVTLKFPTATPPSDATAPLTADPVSPDAPRTEAGYYWGYRIRTCASLSAVFTECLYADGYDLSIGTSERGAALDSVLPGPTLGSKSGSHADPADATLATSAPQENAKLPHGFTHIVIVIGGVAGLEVAVAADSVLASKNITAANAADLFDLWVNLVPGQGSRTIRTEEAVWCALMGLRDYVVSYGKR